MRRITAYTEVYTQIATEKQNGRLTITEPILSPYNTSGLTLLARFTYDYNNYAVVASRSGGTAVNTTTLAAIGVASTEIVINVEAWLWANFFGNNAYILKDSIAAVIARSTGMIRQSVTISETDATSVLIADEPRSTKTVTDIYDINGTFISVFSADDYTINVYETEAEKLDQFDLELDDKTTIGITHSGYDPANPTNVGFKASNNFSIPNTANNAKLVGHCGANDEVFEPWFLNYTIDNNAMISGGKCKVSEVSALSVNGASADSRISLSIADKNTVWDRMKEILWPDFMAEYYTWIEANYTTAYSSLFELINSISLFAYNNHIKIGIFHGDHHPSSEVPILDDFKQYRNQPLNMINLDIGGYSAGVLCTYAYSIFLFIKEKYGIDFFVGTNSVFNNYDGLCYFQNRYLVIKKTSSGYKITFSKGSVDSSTGVYKSEKDKKTVLDFVKDFIVHTGCLVDVISSSEIALQQINDLLVAPAIDFSGRIAKNSISYYPFIEGVAQLNHIDFKEYSKNIPAKSLRQTMVCQNKNIEASSEYIELNEFAPPAYTDRGSKILGLFEDGSRSSFTFLADSSVMQYYYLQFLKDVTNPDIFQGSFYISQILPVGYAMWASMIKKPRRYKLKKWLTSADLGNLKLFKRFWFDELQGTFMITKTNGLNPEKSNEATELELIQITYQKPAGI